MKVMVFLHGTATMHKAGLGVSREERVRQVEEGEKTVKEYEDYVPVGGSVTKLDNWQKQGAEICYLSSHENKKDVEKDKIVLKRYGFPEGEVYFRQDGENYGSVATKADPDVLIEDDCESIGGNAEMTYPKLPERMKDKVKSIVVKEFQGIDHLPDKLTDLVIYNGS